jgi:nickel/cobalt exporter
MNRAATRIALIAVAVGFGVGFGMLGSAKPASAHPLGNFSVNQLAALDLEPDRIDVTVAVDLAELPTLQERPTVDSDGSGGISDAERAAYAKTLCTSFAHDFSVTVNGHRVAWTAEPLRFTYAPGAAGLSTSRLDCTLDARTSLGRSSTVDVNDQFRADRIGWRELTATAHGIHLVNSPIPETSISGGLTAYPQDLLTSPLNVRTAHLQVEPGDGGSSTATTATTLPRSGPSWTVKAENLLRGWVGGRQLTPLIGVLAVLLSLVLGAAHAALPGHGKTVMAAYLAGKQGRPRDALAVGATVTLTHTGGVLVLGLLLTSVAGLAGETVLGWLGVASGVLIAVLGASMLIGLRRRRDALGPDHPHPHPHTHDHPHPHTDGHPHPHSHDHPHPHTDGHPHPHSHDHPHTHDHDHREQRRMSRLGIVSMGIAGGLVPSPSALIILLGAIGLGRTGFGIVLVVAYGLGMAGTLTAAGLLLIRLQARWSHRLPRFGARLSTWAPAGTAALVLLVGVGLAGRAYITL